MANGRGRSVTIRVDGSPELLHKVVVSLTEMLRQMAEAEASPDGRRALTSAAARFETGLTHLEEGG